MKAIPLTLMILLALLPMSNSRAEELTALQIMENVYNRPEGEVRTSDLKVALINKFGDQRVRLIRQFNTDFGEVEKKIMFFLAPADVKQTSFMNWSYDEAGKDDDQWIYLPALKKIKRISSASTVPTPRRRRLTPVSSRCLKQMLEKFPPQ